MVSCFPTSDTDPLTPATNEATKREIEQALKEADAQDFASPEEVKTIFEKWSAQRNK